MSIFFSSFFISLLRLFPRGGAMNVLLCGRVGRIEAQHGLELDNRFTQAILPGQGHSQIEVGLRILRIQPSRFLKTTGRGPQIISFGQGDAQVEMGFSERRVEPDRLLELRQRFRAAARRFEGISETKMDRGFVWLKLDRFEVVIDGLWMFLL